MPPKLDDEKIDQILAKYDNGKTPAEIAQEANVSKETVNKYIDRHRSDDTDDSDDANEGSVVEMTGSDSNLVDLTDEELMEMGEGEFIRAFFTEFDDMGVKDAFVEMIANQAQIRQQIPDEDQLSQKLQAHNSGVGNANDANGIAELYWALAQRYLRARGLGPGGGQPGGMGGGMATGISGGGDWVGAPSAQPQPNNQQQNGGGDDGDWVSTGPQPGRQPNQQGQQPQGGQPQNQQMTQFAQMMRQMQQQQQAMMEQVMQQQQTDEKDALEEKIERLEQQLDGDSESPADSLQEFVELKETLDKINDDDSNEQMEQVVGTLQQQLQSIQQQIAQDDDGPQMGDMMAQSDGQMGAILALAQSGDVDTSEIVEVAQKLGEVETDPNVAEKKYEKEIEEMKVEAEQEKWQSIMEGVEQLTETAGETIGGMVLGGGDESEQTADTQQEARPEVEATATEPEVESESEPNDTSPAQQIVESVDQEADPEPEQEGVTPDTNDDVIEAEGEVVEEGDSEPEPEPEPEHETTDAPEADAEPEPAKADGGEGVVCPGCGSTDFDNERQLRGHKAHCDGEWD